MAVLHAFFRSGVLRARCTKRGGGNAAESAGTRTSDDLHGGQTRPGAPGAGLKLNLPEAAPLIAAGRRRRGGRPWHRRRAKEDPGRSRPARRRPCAAAPTHRRGTWRATHPPAQRSAPVPHRTPTPRTASASAAYGGRMTPPVVGLFNISADHAGCDADSVTGAFSDQHAQLADAAIRPPPYPADVDQVRIEDFPTRRPGRRMPSAAPAPVARQSARSGSRRSPRQILRDAGVGDSATVTASSSLRPYQAEAVDAAASRPGRSEEPDFRGARARHQRLRHHQAGLRSVTPRASSGHARDRHTTSPARKETWPE